MLLHNTSYCCGLMGTVFAFCFTILVCHSSQAQTNKLTEPVTDSAGIHLNPLLRSSFKKGLKPNPLLAEYIRPSKYELMRWPNYPLTPAQVAERDRRYNQSLTQQIVGGIVDSYLNFLLYGRKGPVVVAPRF